MGVIAKVEDLVTGAVLHSFLPAINPVGEQGWSHRNATFSIANINFGSRPQGDFAAPFAPRKYPWQVRVEGRLGYDAAHDALALAIGQGKAVRVVQSTDQGYERVCKGWPDIVGAPFAADSMWYYDFKVEWEFLSLWGERNPVNGQSRAGQTAPALRCGQVAPSLRSGSSYAVAITAATFNVPTTMVDASAVGPGGVPNQPDTAPVLTVTGPYGGAAGFNIANLSDPYACYIYYPTPLVTGQLLVIDAGAWSATLSQGGATTNVTNNLVILKTQPYLFAITANVANLIQLTCVGGSATFGGAASVGVQWNRLFL